MATERKIKIKRTVQTSRQRVFEALSNASRLREWFCDWAWAEPRIGGRYIFRWNSGYEVEGAFIELDPPEELTMIWQGLGEPAQTLVQWELEESGEATEVTVEHVGFGVGPRWSAAYAEAEKGWTEALENLQSVLESGTDLRQARQPFLGVFLDTLTPERIEEGNIATETGVYITNPVEGGAAEAAGVQAGDVIVSLGGHDVIDFNSLTVALRALRTGDAVEVGLVRGQEKLVVQATLREREQPDIPGEVAETVARLREGHAQYNEGLAEATAGLSEQQAEQPPAEGEWSVKQVLAHLIGTEQFIRQNTFQTAVGWYVEGQPDFALGPDQNATILASEKTLAALLARLTRDQEESALLFEHLSEGTLADPYRYRQIVGQALQLGEHTEGHIEQIRQTVAAVQAASGQSG